MTEQELRQHFLNTARSYLGHNEKDGTHKKIIDIYNTIRPLPRSYKVKYTDEWCATFVSAMALKSGMEKIIPLECSCIQHINQLKEMGSWTEADGYTPKGGDLIYYDWQDNGAGDNVGVPDHVGIVESVSGGKIRVIEGNRNQSVAYREIAVNGRYIRGYGTPNFKSMADAAKPDPEAEAAKKWALDKGLIKGYGNGDYGWNNPVTREQLAIILYRLKG